MTPLGWVSVTLIVTGALFGAVSASTFKYSRSVSDGWLFLARAFLAVGLVVAVAAWLIA